MQQTSPATMTTAWDDKKKEEEEKRLHHASSQEILSHLFHRHSAMLRLVVSTAWFALITESVYNPSMSKFFFGWFGSELAPVFILLQTYNLFRVKHLLGVENNNAGYLAKAFFGINAFCMYKMVQAVISIVNSASKLKKVLLTAGIPPNVLVENNSKGNILLALLPIMYISRRFKTITKATYKYADIQQVDLEMYNQWNNLSPRLLYTHSWLLRGDPSTWLELDVLQCAGEDVSSSKKKKKDVLLYIHGGAWALGDKLYAARPLLERLASHGVIVAHINYRMAPHVVLAEQVLDCKRALAFVKANCEKWGGDKNRVFVSGESAG